MTIFGERNKLKEEISKLTAQFNELKSENEKLVTENEELSAELLKFKDSVTVDEYNSLKEKHDELLKALEEEKSINEQLKEGQSDFDAKVATKAQEIVAATGTPLVAIPPNENPAAANNDFNGRFVIKNRLEKK